MSAQARLNATAITITKSGRTLVDGVSLCMQAGELVGLIGPNGAGKSSLLAALAGIERHSSGTIDIDGRPLHRYTDQQRSARIAWLEQSGRVNWPVSVERLVMLGRIPHLPTWGKATEADHQAVEHALTASDCQIIRHQSATTLSGGERSRVLMARALAAEPTLLFADEPVSALDLGHQLQTMEILRQFASKERAALVVLHDLSLAARYCDRLYLMSEGKIAASGGVAAVLSPKNLASVYGVSVISGCEEVPWIVPVARLSSD